MNSVKKLISLSVISTSLSFLNICPSFAVTIGYFNNPIYSRLLESENLFNTLVNGGNTVTQFDSLDASVWQEIVEENQVIVIPDIILQSLAPDLSSETQAVIRNYVNEGGGFLIAGEVEEAILVFNDLFGFSLTDDFWGGDTLLTNNAIGTIFETAPSSLPNPSFTTTVALDSLPLESIVFYDNLLNSPPNEQNSTSLFVTPFGLGKVAFNGFSYSDINNALGWPEATNLTVEFIGRNNVESIPEPSMMFGLLFLGGLGVLSLRGKSIFF